MFGFGTEYEGLAFWLPLIWSGLIAVAVAMYVIADGFDLGVGILFKAARSENWRDRMMFSVAPIWDGNETWLILGGGGLFAVFHIAYAVLMPALYVPIILMLDRAHLPRRRLRVPLQGGALEISVGQRLLLRLPARDLLPGHGARRLRAGLCHRRASVHRRHLRFPHALQRGYRPQPDLRLRVARRHVVRDEDDRASWKSGRGAWRCAFSSPPSLPWPSCRVWVPFLGRQIETRWFTWPNIAFLAPIPLITAYVAYRLFRDLEEGRHFRPFFLAIALFLLGYLGLGVSLFPYIVPPNLTIWDTANTVNSQLFALVGFAIVLPITFAYTAYAYYVFRGKVADEISGGGYGYH